MKVGVIGAMDTEIKMLVENLENVVESKEVFLKFYEGNFGKTPVVIVKSGVGKVNAGICTQTLITKFGCTHIINTGVAGGIASELAVMDTVVSTDAIFHDVNAVGFGYNMCEIPGLGTTNFPASLEMLEIAEKAFATLKAENKVKGKLVKGRVATGDVFVDTREKKMVIKEICNPTCCDMEGAAIGQVAYLYKIPYIIIRSISDLAENTDEVYLEDEAAANCSNITAEILKNLA
jgi:adenosylhomocysteine nucleosidase